MLYRYFNSWYWTRHFLSLRGLWSLQLYLRGHLCFTLLLIINRSILIRLHRFLRSFSPHKSILLVSMRTHIRLQALQQRLLQLHYLRVGLRILVLAHSGDCGWLLWVQIRLLVAASFLSRCYWLHRHHWLHTQSDFRVHSQVPLFHFHGPIAFFLSLLALQKFGLVDWALSGRVPASSSRLGRCLIFGQFASFWI
jgi:hypothetical protein